MKTNPDYYRECPEAYIVGLARGGDRDAFAELVRRRQSMIRNLMRRCSRDVTLADDLAQQVFMKGWQKIRTLKRASAFGPWLNRLAVTEWLQYLRKNDALRDAEDLMDDQSESRQTPGVELDLDQALGHLSDPVRLCVVLSYQEGMSHREISDVTQLPLGTVKSHINRGSEKLQALLSAYQDNSIGLQS